MLLLKRIPVYKRSQKKRLDKGCQNRSEGEGSREPGRRNIDLPAKTTILVPEIQMSPTTIG